MKWSLSHHIFANMCVNLLKKGIFSALVTLFITISYFIAIIERVCISHFVFFVVAM